MANSVLNAPHFQNEEAAFAYVEARLWPDGPVCHHCEENKRIGRLQGKTTRPGLYKCYICKKPFTVRMGTILESSHLPLHLWLQVIHLMCASKKGIATRQIQRMLNCSMKTAWFLGHRIRLAMTPDGSIGPLGGEGKTVEADETELARSRKTKRPEGFRRRTHNPKVMSLVEMALANICAPWCTKIAALLPTRRSTTNSVVSNSTTALTTINSNGRAATCTRTPWKVSSQC